MQKLIQKKKNETCIYPSCFEMKRVGMKWRNLIQKKIQSILIYLSVQKLEEKERNDLDRDSRKRRKHSPSKWCQSVLMMVNLWSLRS